MAEKDESEVTKTNLREQLEPEEIEKKEEEPDESKSPAKNLREELKLTEQVEKQGSQNEVETKNLREVIGNIINMDSTTTNQVENEEVPKSVNPENAAEDERKEPQKDAKEAFSDFEDAQQKSEQ